MTRPESIIFSEHPLNGFTQNYIDKLTADPGYSSRRHVPLFWPTDVYGHGDCIRSFCGWPSFLPLCVYMDHGVSMSSYFDKHELNSRSIVHLTWAKHRFLSLSQQAKSVSKHVIRIPHPFVLLSRSENLVPFLPAAKGSLLFVPHSTGDIDVDFSIESWYEAVLREIQLPTPVCICIHPWDILKGKHIDLIERGFPVVTAGNSRHPLFARRFLSLLQYFSHSVSSTVGSELFFSSFVGNTHYLYGEKPVERLVENVSKNAGLSQFVSPAGENVVLRDFRGEEGASYLMHVYDYFKWPHNPSSKPVRQLIVTDSLAADVAISKKALYLLLLVNFLLLLPFVGLVNFRYLLRRFSS